MQRRLLLKEKNLWFTFDSQPMRFSEREFLLTTGVQCDLIDSEMLRKGKAPSKAPYFWTQKEHFTLEQLQKRLFEPNQLHPLDAEEKLSLKKEHSDRKLSDIEQKEIDDRVKLWAKNKNFIFMISSLHQIIWSNSSWETVHHFNLVNNDNEIGLAKRKALLALHPDKQHGASAEQKYLATRLFSVIKHEWDIYIKKKQV
ncbi:unnamed protein product [Arabidopsis arenosa]|uniref:J domain-containing protein n=1 Tax=Arabidopsis arenosa TaxID=38785 RepID=A0A8S1ZQ41_ARAAE|nr:unnamed protein product [Arabidopsis arenosa]